MTCTDSLADLFSSGEWSDAVYCWLTNSGDPVLAVMVPTLIYGVILTSMFIVGQSVVMPVVISIILAGVIFATFPATGLTIAVITIMFTMTVAGTVLTWRIGL